MTFRQKWLAEVERKNSVLCAGLDLSHKKILKENKRDWTLKYIEAVAPYCSAIKPNINYWKREEDAKILEEACALSKSLGLIVIEDSKIADIGSTNEEG